MFPHYIDRTTGDWNRKPRFCHEYRRRYGDLKTKTTLCFKRGLVQLYHLRVSTAWVVFGLLDDSFSFSAG